MREINSRIFEVAGIYKIREQSDEAIRFSGISMPD